MSSNEAERSLFAFQHMIFNHLRSIYYKIYWLIYLNKYGVANLKNIHFLLTNKNESIILFYVNDPFLSSQKLSLPISCQKPYSKTYTRRTWRYNVDVHGSDLGVLS
jgi:hypothetical protein